MLIRRMVHDEVDQHADATLFAAVGELDKITQSAVTGIHPVVVADVIAIVTHRRGLEWHQPYGGHAQPVEIVQPPHQAGKVADAISVGIHVLPTDTQ